MIEYLEHMREDRRLVILRLLVEAEGASNESNLFYGIGLLGHERATRADLRADLEFLREAGLVTHDWVAGQVLVAHLTPRGLDVAQGKVKVPGVKKPSIV